MPKKVRGKRVTKKSSSKKRTVSKKVKPKIKGWRVFWAGIVFAIVGQIMHSLGAWASMKYYLMESYFPVWSKIMMPTAGPPPAMFMYYSIAFALVTGILFALVYAVIKQGIPGKTLSRKGMIYGLIVYLVGNVPSYLAFKLLIYLPCGLIWAWAIEGLIINLINGILVAKIIK